MTIQVNPNSVYAKTIKRGQVPKPSQMLNVPLDFSSDTIVQCSLNVLHGLPNTQGINGIQSVFIDNTNNGDTISIQSAEGPVYTCPPFAQAIFPYMFSGELLSFIASSGGGVLVNVYFLNTREQAQLWSTKIPIGGNVNVSGSDVFTQPFAGSFTDASATLANGGTSQLLLAANGNRQLIGIRNPATPASQFGSGATVEPVYLNFGAPAAVNGATSWELLPGEQLPQFLMTTVQAINWTAATAGHILIAKWM